MSIALYELSEAHRNILNLIDEEIPDQDIMNALRAIEGHIETKAVNIANLVKSLEVEVDAIAAEEKRLARRKKSRENTVRNVKQYLRDAMEQVNMLKIKTPTMSISIQNNPPSVHVLSEDEIPGKFLTLIPEHYIADKKAIAEAIKGGEEVPGCELVRGRSLRIR